MRAAAVLGGVALLVVALVTTGRSGAQPGALLQQQPAAKHQVRLAQTQKMDEMAVSGEMAGADDAEQATAPMSFEFPVALPGPPPPPGPNVINIGPRPKKVPVCKECVAEEKKVKFMTKKVYADNKKAKAVLEQEEDSVEAYEGKMKEAVAKIQDRTHSRVGKYRSAIKTLKTKPGAAGQMGRPGAQGEDGRAGAPGIPGPMGAAGGQGIKGPIGKVGPQGWNGKRGLQGPEGPEGAEGLVGPLGANGPAGPMGLSVNGYCNSIGGKVYKGACFKSSLLDANADSIPESCEPYSPVASWEQSDFAALQSMFKDRDSWDQINRESPALSLQKISLPTTIIECFGPSVSGWFPLVFRTYFPRLCPDPLSTVRNRFSRSARIPARCALIALRPPRKTNLNPKP